MRFFRYGTTVSIAAAVLLFVGSVCVFGAGRVEKVAQATVEKVADGNPVSQPQKVVLPEIVAEVNAEKITRDQLTAESLRIHGAEVLDRILNRTLVLAECKRKQIFVTRDDVNNEIAKLAKTNRLSAEQFLEMVKNDSGMTAAQYSEDVIWPRLALMKLVASELEVTDQEIEREYMKAYGPSVSMQMISCKTKEDADKVYAMVQADPSKFGDVAKNYSTDLGTAGNKGRIPPIRHYTLPDPALEDRFFSMNEGDISEIIGPYGPTAEYLIFRCENKYDSVVPQDKIDQIKEALRNNAVNAKLTGAAHELFERLKKEANVVNVLNDEKLRQQYPKVAALVNGQAVYLDAVIDKCLELYAKQDIEMMIHQTLIRQECKKVMIQVSDQDIDTEIWIRAAETTMPKEDGSPNVEEYLKRELAAYQVPEDVYRRNFVWPALAVKKLSEPLVKITDEDLKKEFDAHFGERVQCLGIVLRDERQAREVWQKARTIPARDNRSLEEVFGDLAAQFSIEPGSRQMRGRIDPINRSGDMPEVEEEAFSLKPGELSSIIQVNAQTFVILYCQERIPAEDVKFDDVKENIENSVRRKKEMAAADKYYRDLIERSAINNFVTGQKFTPGSAAGAAPQGAPAGGAAGQPAVK
ncbi:MAG: peptidylprolyl isomerase [Thermoguttaceae bacterium]|nr:peptidylprolyl isomerase [Thermoguttaceae bacterium]